MADPTEEKSEALQLGDDPIPPWLKPGHPLVYDHEAAGGQIPSPVLGDLVLYLERTKPPRAGLVSHVYADGRTVDLVVFHDGNPEDPKHHDAFCRGHGVYRSRMAIPCAHDDPACARRWAWRSQTPPRTLIVPR